MCCEGCWKQEKETLMALNSRLGNNALSWLHNTDCCQWEGVECNTITGRITKIKLQSAIGPWHLNYSDFLIFKDLKILDLSSSQLSNCTRINQGLKNLEVINLGDNPYLDNATNILSCLDGLSSLKSLSLSENLFDTTSSQIFQIVLEKLSSKLLHLEVLDIGYNNLTNEILPSLRGFRSLKELNLASIGLNSDLHIQGLCAMLKNVEILDISDNNFNDTDIASALSVLSSLKNLNLQVNQITLRSIHNISKLKSLEILDLAGNNLNLWPLVNHGFAWPASLQDLVLRANSLSNNIVSSLNGLTRLESLDLSVNNLKGSLDISGMSTLTSLKILDFSDNQLVGFAVHKGSKSLSRLDILALDSNMINGSNLQESFQAFPSVRNLTLRQNKFKGTTLARGFRGLNKLEYLALDESSNLENEFFKSIGDHLPSLKVLSMLECGIKGTLPIGDWYKLKKLEELDLSYNEFVGKLPSSFVNMTSLRTLALTDNHFIGNIGPNLASFTSLEYLNFEGNQFDIQVK
ncbi:hypothetical protein P8452_11287 [Trifolium repens]|nr:hypothetical protein P8452_11287 [Trifolium repens]